MHKRPRGSTRTRYESDLSGDERQTEDEDKQLYSPQSSAWSANTNEYQYTTEVDTGGFVEDGVRPGAWQGEEPSASSSSHPVPCTWTGCGRSFSSISQRDRHYRTMHANNGERPYRCIVDGCQADVTSWTRAEKLRLHNKRWHGPYHCFSPGCSRGIPNGFGSQSELDAHLGEAHPGPRFPIAYSFASQTTGAFEPSEIAPLSPATGVPDNQVFSGWQPTLPGNQPSEDSYGSPPGPKGDPSTTYREVDRIFQVQQSSFFKWGRVFKMHWAEPLGSGSPGGKAQSSVTLTRPENFFHKVRRFIVIKENRGHALCLSIISYGGQGTLKKGVHPEHHAIVYSRGQKPKPMKGEEEKGLTKRPIEIRMDKSEKLDPSSRVNYAKVYTVEHNVKVASVGKVSEKSEWQLTADYNQLHPPLPVRGTHPSQGSFNDNEYSNNQPAPYISSYPDSSTTGPIPAPSYSSSGLPQSSYTQPESNLYGFPGVTVESTNSFRPGNASDDLETYQYDPSLYDY